jgi:hypothetical protein
MNARNPRLDTNVRSERFDAAVSARAIWRMQIADTNSGTYYGTDANLAKCVLINSDGSLGAKQYIVKVGGMTGSPTHVVGDIINVCRPQGGTYNGRPVVLAEVAGMSLPKPTARYQVFTPIDDTLTPIWTSLRFQ